LVFRGLVQAEVLLQPNGVVNEEAEVLVVGRRHVLVRRLCDRHDTRHAHVNTHSIGKGGGVKQWCGTNIVDAVELVFEEVVMALHEIVQPVPLAPLPLHRVQTGHLYFALLQRRRLV